MGMATAEPAKAILGGIEAARYPGAVIAKAAAVSRGWLSRGLGSGSDLNAGGPRS
jgi:hypothetical protein